MVKEGMGVASARRWAWARQEGVAHLGLTSLPAQVIALLDVFTPATSIEDFSEV